MASPIAHSFAGFWTFLIFANRLRIRLLEQWRQYLPELILVILLANLPDFDFFISLAVLGNDHLHRELTHSLVAGAFVALTFACVWRITKRFWESVILYFTAYGSHLLIDFCTGNKLGLTRSGSGIPLLWPSHKEFSSPLILFPGVRHGTLGAIFSMDNLWTALYELLTFGAITVIVLALRALLLRQENYASPSRTEQHELFPTFK